MKKNITINLFGTLYAIDEDAYELLRQYIDNMKAYFGRREGGDEIADDIEHRVAELFSSLKAEGHEAITIEDVQAIIQRIGNPEDMGDGDADETADRAASSDDGADGEASETGNLFGGAKGRLNAAFAWLGKRRLYRDPGNAVLGGVLSGLCRYFGGSDPLPWRIIFVLLTIFSVSSLAIVYLLLWAFIPSADTAEDRLRMQGKPVNPSTLNEEIMHPTNGERPMPASAARGCLGSLVRFVALCVAGLALLILGSLGLSLLFGIGTLAYATCIGTGALLSEGIFDADFINCVVRLPVIGFDLWVLAVSLLIVLGLLIYGFIRLFSHLRHRAVRPLRPGTRIGLLIIGLLAAVGAITSGLFLAFHTHRAERLIEVSANTVNGIYITGYDRDRLADVGWNVLALSNCNADGRIVGFCSSLEQADGEDCFFYFDRDDRHRQMAARLERTVDLPAGDYHLEGLVYASGHGAYVYAQPAGAPLVKSGITSRDVDGHGTMENVSYGEACATAGVFGDTLSYDRYNRLRQNFEAWDVLRSATFHHAGGPLSLGIRCDAVAGSDVREMGVKVLKAVAGPAPDVEAISADTAAVRLPSPRH